MTTVQLKREITSLLDVLPEPNLAVIFDFVQFLAERELQVAWINAQSQSVAYQEWIGRDNDIYDEVFADDPKGDEVLLNEALAALEQSGNKPDAWTSWKEFERELD